MIFRIFNFKEHICLRTDKPFKCKFSICPLKSTLSDQTYLQVSAQHGLTK